MTLHPRISSQSAGQIALNVCGKTAECLDFSGTGEEIGTDLKAAMFHRIVPSP